MENFGKAVAELLRQAYSADYYESTWFKDNEPGSSLLQTLDQLTAEQASRTPPVGRHSVAAHAGHLSFALEASISWAHDSGEKFDWESSWARQTVDDAEWRELRSELQARIEDWIEYVEDQNEFKDDDHSRGLLGSIAHAAYHLGAVRQLAADMVSHSSD